MSEQPDRFNAVDVDLSTLAALREAIDAIDSAIVGLLVTRLATSRGIQLHRSRAGDNRRVVEYREEQIMRRYAHGAPGSEPVLRAILEYCRGPEVRL